MKTKHILSAFLCAAVMFGAEPVPVSMAQPVYHENAISRSRSHQHLQYNGYRRSNLNVQTRGQTSRPVAGQSYMRGFRYADAAQRQDPSLFITQLLGLINQERQRHGIAPLCTAPDLMQAAAIRADEVSDVFAHIRPNGEKCISLLTGGYETAGEILARGTSAPEETLRLWLDSPSHYGALLKAAYKEIGIGFVYRPGTRHRYYCAVMFRQPRTETGALGDGE